MLKGQKYGIEHRTKMTEQLPKIVFYISNFQLSGIFNWLKYNSAWEKIGHQILETKEEQERKL